ncbi:MAG TPA: haloacid dehalogenase type II [Casimicrobiaceae bacterium]|nr:haloacid dehalogenase type II [Casimicrobiaceae bacterium]
MARAVPYKRPAALLFDVFGTVVDWRGSVSKELARIGRRQGVRADWDEFADAWRAGYRPAMDRVRRGELPWQPLDSLHLQMLRGLVGRFGLALDEREIEAVNLVWHRLAPWADARAGLRRLKRGCIIGTLSNGNMALLVELSKAANLPWDCILSAELFRHYKPDPEVYLGAAALLALEPADVMLVAAHKDDLAAARRCGLQTAYVQRPLEFGPGTARGGPDRLSTLNAGDFADLADQLGL